MLRTHGELGYRQEQRFHLELGLLKMAHAQRLLPIEQLLSEAAGAAWRSATGGQTVDGAGDQRRSEAAVAVRARVHKCFAVRRGFGAQERIEAGAFRGRTSAQSVSPSAGAAAASVVMGSAAPAAVTQAGSGANFLGATSTQTRVAKFRKTSPAFDDVRGAVLNALSDAGQRMLVDMLELASGRSKAMKW